MYKELLLGFMFILILSDSRDFALAFAKQAKNIYIVMLTLFLLLDRKQFVPFNGLYRRFIPFFVMAYFALFFSDVLFIGFQKTTSYLFLLMVVPNYLMLLYREEGEKVFKDVVMFAMIMLTAGFLMRVITPENVTLAGRYTGVFGNPNGLGIYCVLIGILYYLVNTHYPGLFEKRERIFITILVVASILLSGSRGSLFALGFFFFFQFFYRYHPAIGFIAFLVLATGYEVLAGNLTVIITGLGLEEYFRLDTLDSGSGRLVAWNFAWHEIQKNLVFGKGFAHTEYIYRLNYNVLSQLGHQGNAHNSYLTFWLETGLLGLLSYLYGLTGLFLSAAKKSRLTFPILFSVLFMVNIESWLVGSLNPVTIILFVIITILTIEHKEKEEEETEDVKEEVVEPTTQLLRPSTANEK